MKNKWKKLIASILSGVMVLGMSSFPVSAAVNPETALTLSNTNLGTVTLTAEGDQVKYAGTVLKYDAAVSGYDLNYSMSIPMDQIWTSYDSLKDLAPNAFQYVGLGGEIVTHTELDSQLNVNADKFTVAAIQNQFEQDDLFHSQLLEVTDASVSDHAMTVKMKFKEGVTGATIESVKAANGNKFNDAATIKLPAGALTLPTNKFVDEGTISTSTTDLSASVELGIPDRNNYQTRIAQMFKPFMENCPDRVETIILPCSSTVAESVLTMRHIETGTEESPANIQVKKDLQMDPNITTPAETFTFNFVGKAVDDDTSASVVAGMPAIGAKSVTYAADDLGNSDSGTKVVEKTTGNILDITAFKHAGAYKYTVTEAGGSTEGMTYSDAEFELTVYVANKEDGSGLYFSAVSAKNEAGEKCDLTFVNSYVKRGGSEEGDEASLTISKTTTGEYADKTKQFDVAVTLANPAVGGKESYKGTVGTTEYTFVPGTATTVKLADGDVLSFADLPVGTKYTAVEAGTANYTPSVKITVNGADTPIELNAAAGAELSTEERVVGESTNKAEFTNTYKTVTPTGIIVHNLPFIMMILVAIGGALVYVISRRRRYNQ
ncbi:MAG: hypothetical protein EOM18_08725 [Clostridia bacterium]|nr:hypothetical protein [Clostridia bacterium]